MLDLGSLLDAASAMEATAADVRSARDRLARALTGTQWRSTAASSFAERAGESAARLAAAAEELDAAARQLRRHHAAATARQAELGAAADAVLTAGRAAAGAGAQAAADAMAGARAAFERALAELAAGLAEAGGDVVARLR